jgi:hypothetical protein
MTPAQLEAKFSDCAAQALSAETGKRVFAFLDRLPEQRTFEGFWPLLRRA